MTSSKPEARPAAHRRGLHDRICLVEDCTAWVGSVRTEGLCHVHYQQHLKGLEFSNSTFISRKGPCLVEGCERARRSRGLCGPHYDRGRRRAVCPACGGTMGVRSGVCDTCNRAALAAQLPTEKTCRQCDRVLPVGNFGLRKAREGAAKWRSSCRECEAANSRMRMKNARRERSAERLSTPYLGLRSYAKKLGIPWAEVVDRYPADNRCQICKRTPQEANPGGRFVRLALDHCHETGKLRGFLCGPCNSALGLFGDAPKRLRAASRYLIKNAAPLSTPTPEVHQLDSQLDIFTRLVPEVGDTGDAA